jgi:small-conductance mechanosensitive channel
MQQVVAWDQAKLERLRTDLESRRVFLDALTSRMATYQRTHDELEARLGEVEPGSEEEARLKADVARLERRYELFNRHATLTFKAEEALRKQISGLESKIETDREALAIFRGELPAEGEPSEALPTRSSVPAGATLPGSRIPVVPGVPAPAAPAAARDVARPSLLPETPEQIAARQELERKQRAARLAEEAVVTFVRRLDALEEQTELERVLLQVDEETLENLAEYIQYLRDTREELLAAGGDEAELATLEQQLARAGAESERVEAEVERRRFEVDTLEERRAYAREEQERVSAVAETRRQEAEAARKWVVWIESPLYPGNLTRWAVERGPRVLAVLLLAGLVLLVLRVSLRRIARAVVTKSRKARSSAVNRADTLALSFQSLATTLILAACVLLVLQEAGLDVKTVLGGAAILGVAIAFGAQNLMRDYFTGFMMLLEDQYELGDLVTIGSITGTVERVNMRVTMLRDLEGRVHFIPNGQIGSLTNRTYDWARALVEIPVGPGEDVDRVMALLLEVARELKADPEWAEEIVDEPQMLGVDKFTESGVVIKLMLKTHPERMFPVRRELLRRVKKALDAEGIDPGFPVRVVREPRRSDR